MTDQPVTIQYLHQSGIAKATQCGVAFEKYQDRDRPYSTGVNRALGTAYHAGIEVLYRTFQEVHGYPGAGVRSILPAMYKAAKAAFTDEVAKGGEAFDWQYQAPTARKDQITLDATQAISMVRNLLTRYVDQKYYWPPDRYGILGVEHKFELDFPGRPGWKRRGTMDLVLHDRETGWIHGVDHKTAKTKWRAGKESHGMTPQPAYYSQAIIEEFGSDHVTFYFDVMSFENTFQRVESRALPEHMQATMLKADAVIQLVENGGPYLPNTDHFLCSPHYCDYWDECPYGPVLKGA